MKIRIGKTTDYFLSSHTVEGYRSFFDSALQTTTQLVTLKGASVQIRSRICRQVGIALIDRGYNVELIHGLGNPCDLEGIMVPELGVMMVDQEKILANKVAELTEAVLTEIDLNQYIWEDKYPIFEAKIRDLREQMAVNIDLVYEYLSQAKKELVSHEGGLLFSEEESNHVVERLAKTLLFKNYGRTNHRFGRSLAGGGQVNYYKGLLKNIKKQYFLNGINYVSGCQILNYLSKEANKGGFEVEAYHDFLDGDLVELVIIPDLEIAIGAKALTEDFEELLTYKDTACQPALAKVMEPNLEKNLAKINETMADIKALSSTVGELYQGVVDFAAIEVIEQQLVIQLLEQAKVAEEKEKG